MILKNILKICALMAYLFVACYFFQVYLLTF